MLLYTPLSPTFCRLALWGERWVLSALSLLFAWEQCQTVRLLVLIRAARAVLPTEMALADRGLATGVDLADLSRYGLLAAGDLLAAICLLLSRRPQRPPQRLGDVVVPLGATYCAVLLNVPALFPGWATTPLVPKGWEVPLATFGFGLWVLGALITLGAMCWLGRSLGIFVSVRRVVLRGPYRWVRHPIYTGYALSLAGLFLTGCTARLALVAAAAVALLVWRARLEEHALSLECPAYRCRREKSGFFLPRLRRSPTTRASRVERPRPAHPSILPVRASADTASSCQ